MFKTKSYNQKDTNENVVVIVSTILDQLGNQGKITSTPDINGDNVDLKLSIYVDKNGKQIEKNHIVKLTKDQYDFYKDTNYFYENVIAFDNNSWAQELIDDKTVNHYMEGNDLIVEL